MADYQFTKTTAYGRKTLFSRLTCDEGKEIYSAPQEKEYCGECLPQTVWFETEPDTWYFLNVTGRVIPPEWTNIQWGICDSEGLRLENPHTKHELSFFVWRGGLDQELTVQGQDGSEYDRIYGFFSGNNTKLGFFIEGTEGRVALKNIKIFKYEDAKPIATMDKSFSVNWVEDANTCKPEDNIVLNEEEWLSQFHGYGDIMNYSDGELHYESQGFGYYYIAWLPIEKTGIYNFCFSSKVLESGNTKFGVIGQDTKGKRHFIMVKNNAAVGDWNSYADMYALTAGTKLGFAVFNGGGKIDFKDFKLYPSAVAMKPEDFDKIEIKNKGYVAHEGIVK